MRGGGCKAKIHMSPARLKGFCRVSGDGGTLVIHFTVRLDWQRASRYCPGDQIECMYMNIIHGKACLLMQVTRVSSIARQASDRQAKSVSARQRHAS